MNTNYKKHILDHYRNPHNFTKIDNPDYSLSATNPLCGDNIKIYLKLENDKISEVGFQGEGCAISIASTSIVTDFIKGKTIKQIKKINEEKVLQLLGTDIHPSRMNCALLPLEALNGILN